MALFLLARSRIGAPQAQVGQRIEWGISRYAAMVKNFLKFYGRLKALPRGQVGLATQVNGIQMRQRRNINAQFVWGGGLQYLDCSCGIVAIDFELRARSRQPQAIDQSISRELPGQIACE